MAVTRLSTQFRVREDVFDNITPNVVVQRDVSAPHGEWKPAAWLPVLFTKSNIHAGEDAFVISSGKVVGLDSQNRVVPAGLRAALVDTFASTTAVLTYTSTDYEYGVIDLTTGVAVASSAGASYTAAQVATALLDRGLVPASAMATSGNSFVNEGSAGGDTDIAEIVEFFISEAIGVAAYDIFVWSGRPEDGDQVFTNYSKQHLVQFLTELQMKVPHRTLGSDTTTFDLSAITVVTAQSDDGLMPAAGEVWHETALDDVTRWSSAVDGKNVYAIQLDNDFIASNTARTTISCDVSGILDSEKSSIGLISQAGDFYVDTRTGTLFIHGDAWDTQQALEGASAGAGDFVVTYYYYAVASSGGASSDRYIFLDGEPKPGAFLSYDEHSNFVEMGSAQDALGTSNVRSIGRLIDVDVEPKDLLQYTKTAFQLTGMSAVSKMPGSATAGYSDLITLATSEEVADQIAIINLKVN
jgi:hypothetical protein